MQEEIKRQWILWKRFASDDPDLINELNKLEELEAGIKEREIIERFYKDLEFGTGGLRGIIGAGPNRMNIYTVARATRGYADFLKMAHREEDGQAIAVAIAYDSRIKSEKFANVAAAVLASAGLRVYLFRELAPTPLLSYVVPRLKCEGGIVITASHNPSQYNGYKVYGKDGGQITGKTAAAIFSKIGQHDFFEEDILASLNRQINKDMISYVPDKLIEQYLEDVSLETFGGNINTDLKIVYSPLNGTGLKYVSKILEQKGFTHIHIVEEQKNPDGFFTTCPVPNPERREALELALRDAKELEAELVFATDPDCDRLGVAVRQGKEFRLLTGNEIGVLLLDYICQRRKELGLLPDNAVAFKTIVTTDLAARVASDFGVRMEEVLTGFKYIGEKIGQLEKAGQKECFILGLEESYGYLSGTYVRDKDGVNAAALVSEMAGYYKSKGKGLADVLEDIYNRYGVYLNVQYTLPFPGKDGADDMKKCMESCREHMTEFPSMGDIEMVRAEDYKISTSWLHNGETEKLLLPSSNVVRLFWEDGSSISIRPSGTEPKLKMYVQAVGKTRVMAEGKECQLKDLVKGLMGIRGNF